MDNIKELTLNRILLFLAMLLTLFLFVDYGYDIIDNIMAERKIDKLIEIRNSLSKNTEKEIVEKKLLDYATQKEHSNKENFTTILILSIIPLFYLYGKTVFQNTQKDNKGDIIFNINLIPTLLTFLIFYGLYYVVRHYSCISAQLIIAVLFVLETVFYTKISEYLEEKVIKKLYGK